MTARHYPALTVDRHVVDGFSITWTGPAGDYNRRRFIGYTVREARAIVRADINAARGKA